MAQRVTFYIDGFNFYYGLRRTRKVEPWWGNYYWIDMVKLCESFLGDEQVLSKVNYFTVSPLNPEKSNRQSAFLNTKSLINGDRSEVVRGKYLEKQITCPNCRFSISALLFNYKLICISLSPPFSMEKTENFFKNITLYTKIAPLQG